MGANLIASEYEYQEKHHLFFGKPKEERHTNRGEYAYIAVIHLNMKLERHIPLMMLQYGAGGIIFNMILQPVWIGV